MGNKLGITNQPTIDCCIIESVVRYRCCYQIGTSSSRPCSHSKQSECWSQSTVQQYGLAKWPILQTEAIFLPEFKTISEHTFARSFVLEHKINEGTFGVVWRAIDREGLTGVAGQRCAIKLLSKAKVISESAIQQVKEEIDIQKLCGHHPFIVGSFGCWQTRRQLIIATELIDGGELSELLLRHHNLPEQVVKVYVAQLAIVLDFLHNVGVIYRDLKPENILYDKETYNLHVCDFGLSKWLSYGDRTNTICGTKSYMAPEIGSDGDVTVPYDHSVDWWSLGVVACLMLTNQYPVHHMRRDNDSNLLEFIEFDAKTLSPAAKDLLNRLLVINPSMRLHSLRKLQTIAFYKDFNFKDVSDRRVDVRQLLFNAVTTTNSCLPYDLIVEFDDAF